ncbi:MAG: Glu/Leu/Phe/Val dehydrogenase dimerization domain-containing protein [Pseudomonadota bacterium]|nr:Glu/Leu/Phe/Val dehydrogenase dimerization domain-containing protein [Pseudomonadota bacterium]
MNSNLIARMKTEKYDNVHFFHDDEQDLTAVVAIHSTKFGPAIGGARFKEYENNDSAITDVLNLAQGMTYKAIIHDLPHGGAKAVIIKNRNNIDRTAFFSKYAEFVDSLQGKYITAEDSGTLNSDMHIIKKRTPYVLGTGLGSPSPSTALGIKQAIVAALETYLNKDLSSSTIAIQGIGNVGEELCKLLTNQGAQVIISDINASKVAEVSKKYGAKAVSPEEIIGQTCDLFAPCALGGSINIRSLDILKAKIICGGANNQVYTPDLYDILHERKILYVPDYLANGGGLIKVAGEYANEPEKKIREKVENIYYKTQEIILQSLKQDCSANDIANKLVIARLTNKN